MKRTVGNCTVDGNSRGGYFLNIRDHLGLAMYTWSVTEQELLDLYELLGDMVKFREIWKNRPEPDETPDIPVFTRLKK